MGKNPEFEFISFLNNKKRDFDNSIDGKKEGSIKIKKIDGRKLIEIDNIKIALDCWDKTADIIFISHAHMDHIPFISIKAYKKLKQGDLDIKFLCSPITKEIAESRTKGKFKILEESWLLNHNYDLKDKIEFQDITLKLIENGHTFGSTSLLIEGSQTILYTSDFLNGEKETLRKGLNPIKCDHLILECTYGAPRYKFPPFKDLITNINSYIKVQLSKKYPVILLCYAFGKSQNLLQYLDNSFNIILERHIAENTQILEKYGIKFPEWQSYGNFNKNMLASQNNYVLFLPPYNIFKEPYKTLVSSGAKVAALSGKIVNKHFREKFQVDNYFPFSDHCDFYQLLDFVKRSQPKCLYLEHGKFNELTYYLNNLLNLFEFNRVKIL